MCAVMCALEVLIHVVNASRTNLSFGPRLVLTMDTPALVVANSMTGDLTSPA